MPLGTMRKSPSNSDFTWAYEWVSTPLKRSEQSDRAHRLLRHLLEDVCRDPEIYSRTRSGSGRRPLAFDHRRRLIKRRLSVSHLPTIVAAAVSTSRIGIDLVDLSMACPPSFERSWFTQDEIRKINGRPIHFYWAAKEASYKALGAKEPFRPGDWLIDVVDQQSDRCVVKRQKASTAAGSSRATRNLSCSVFFDNLPNCSVGVAFALPVHEACVQQGIRETMLPRPSLFRGD